MNRKNEFLSGVHDGIPIGLGYFAVSFSFGMIAIKGGLSILQATLISLTNLTSAGQFAGLKILIAGGSFGEIALSQIIINLRYILMSFSLSQKIDRSEPWVHRFGVAFGVTDEIFGVSAAREGKLSPFYSYGAMSMAIPGWTLGTLAGAVSGSLMPAFVLSAMSVALYGMFLAVVIPPAKKQRHVLYAVLAAMACSTLFQFAPVLSGISSGFTVIIITLAVSAVAAVLHPIEEPQTEKAEKEAQA